MLKMFPIIPHHFPLSTFPLQEPTSLLNNLQLNKSSLVADCDIPVGSISEKFEIGDVIKNSGLKNNEQNILSLNPNSKLVIKTTNIKICTIIQNIKLANDCHSYNTQVDLENSWIILKTVKQIHKGQEIILWFSEKILALIQMAFLTPANIQGQKRYVCHKCSTNFEYPNPLKLHLTLDCGRYSISQLWRNLQKTLKYSEDELNLSPLNLTKSNSFNFELSLTKIEAPERISKTIEQDIKQERSSSVNNITLQEESRNMISNSPSLLRPTSEPARPYSSAFRPYSSKSCPRFNNNTIGLPHFDCFRAETNEILLRPNFPSTDVSLSQAAQMETLVSNLGKSKQGHLCIYCGKIYSRKYGLKIHIRTHTGFKPLKCKFCLRPFGDPSNLNKHVRLHAEGETPYKCELCGKVLVRRRDLERHLKSRHLLDNPDSSTS